MIWRWIWNFNGGKAIDAGTVTAFESKLLQRPKFSNKTVNNTLTLLGRILEDARKSGYLKVHYAEGLLPPGQREPAGSAAKTDAMLFQAPVTQPAAAAATVN